MTKIRTKLYILFYLFLFFLFLGGTMAHPGPPSVRHCLQLHYIQVVTGLYGDQGWPWPLPKSSKKNFRC
jgi:hypothetical protein